MKNVMARAAVSAVVGGTASKLGGGKFANGAGTAAFVSVFNGDHEITNAGFTKRPGHQRKVPEIDDVSAYVEVNSSLADGLAAGINSESGPYLSGDGGVELKIGKLGASESVNVSLDDDFQLDVSRESTVSINARVLKGQASYNHQTGDGSVAVGACYGGGAACIEAGASADVESVKEHYGTRAWNAVGLPIYNVTVEIYNRLIDPLAKW